MADLNALIAQGAQFRVPPPVDPMGNMPQLMQMRASQNQNELAQYQLSSARREDASTNALNTAYQNAYDPATGKIDSARLLQSLASSGAGSKIPGVQKSLTDAEIAQLNRQKLQGEVNAQPGDAAYKAAQTGDLNEKTLDLQLSNFNKRFSPLSVNGPDDVRAYTIAMYNDPKLGPLATQMKSFDEALQANLAEFAKDPNMWKVAHSNVSGKDIFEALKGTRRDVNLGNVSRGGTVNAFGNVVPGSQVDTPIGGAPISEGEKARLKQSADQFNRRLEQETAVGVLSPDTLEFAANLVAQGGAMPSLGMGKAAAKMRSEVLSRAAQIATEGSGSAAGGAADVLSNRAGLTGRAAEERVLGAQGANVALASSEARKMIELAKGYSAAIDRTQYPSINAIENAVNKGTGDKNIVALNTALNSLVNAYARAINPRGVATVSDKNHAREIVNSNYAKGQLDIIFSVMDEEMIAAQESTGAARAALRGKPAAVTTPKEVDFGDLRK